MPRTIEGLHVLIDSQINPLTLQLVADAEPEVIQLRDKEVLNRDMVIWGEQVKQVIGPNTLLVVNDRLEVAEALDADGIHVGQSDADALKVRTLFPNKILGVSANTVEEIKYAKQAGADYVGIGPIFPTRTKTDAIAPIGLKTLAQLSEHSELPVVAIGGITNRVIFETVHHGASGAAVIGAVLRSEQPGIATKHIRKSLAKAKGQKI